MPTSDKKAQVQEFFGAHAREYIDSASHARGASLERLVACTEPTGAEVVLDVATGAGHNALSFAPHVRRVVGLDLTPWHAGRSVRTGAPAWGQQCHLLPGR